MSSLLVPLFETIYGPIYFSVVLTTAFYGVTCMQTFFYYVHYPNDSLFMKSFVAILWALDTIHEALTVSGAYKYIIAGLTNPFTILDAVPDIVMQIIPETLVSLCAQGFFVYRIYIFSGKNIVAPILWLIQSIYQIVATILYVVKAAYSVNGKVRIVTYIVLDDHFFTSLTAACFAVAAAVDVLIAIAMTYLLIRKRRSNGFASTEHILQRLTLFAVNTGIWTALFAVLSFILLRAFPQTSYYVAVATPLSSIYCNTLLANLNARTYIRDGSTPRSAGSDFLIADPSPALDSGEKQRHDVVLVSPTPQKASEVKFMHFDWSTTSAQNRDEWDIAV